MKNKKLQIKIKKRKFREGIKFHKAQSRPKKISRLQALIHTHKAQIRMSETIAVMFIFFVLIVFGIIFYYNYSKVAAKEKQAEILGSRAMDITLKSLFLPELICSRGGAEPEDNCFDMMKLRQVNKTFREHFGDYYFDLFPYTTITVEKLYPLPAENWTLYDKPKPGWENREATYFVVSLRDNDGSNPGGYLYNLGVLKVEVYS